MYVHKIIRCIARHIDIVWRWGSREVTKRHKDRTHLLETSAGKRLREVLAVDERFDLHTCLVLGGENSLDSFHLYSD